MQRNGNCVFKVLRVTFYNCLNLLKFIVKFGKANC